MQALHRVRARLMSKRTARVNESRAFLLDRGIAVAKGIQRLRKALPEILAEHASLLLPRMIRIIEALVADWRRLDDRIEENEIEDLAQKDAPCKRLMTAPGIGPLISSATVATIGGGDMFSKGRDFGAWLGI